MYVHPRLSCVLISQIVNGRLFIYKAQLGDVSEF